MARGNRTNNLPTPERLKEVLRYDRKHGHLYWRVATSNRVKVGDKAGSIQKNGYIKVYVDGKNLWAHRVCWAIATGVWPLEDIDHENRIHYDNRFRNLRDVTVSINMHNQREIERKSKSALIGAVFDKRSGKYISKFQLDGKSHHLGIFTSPLEAHQTVMSKKKELGLTV